MVRKRLVQGFALPTVLIASTIMLTVLVIATAAAASISTSINNQYYQTLAREAAESTLVRARECILTNGGQLPAGVSTISSYGTNCNAPPSGDIDGHLETPAVIAANYAKYAVMYDSSARIWTSGTAQVNANQPNTITAIGQVNLLRANGSTVRTITAEQSVRISSLIGVRTVPAFGYNGIGSAFFGTAGQDGIARTVGLNSSGQLGNGTTTNSLTPVRFTTPSSVTKMYANFVSLGYQLFATTTDGNLYGAGYNSSGQLGNSSGLGGNQSTPVKFGLPSGVSAVAVAPSQGNTYVLGSNNVLYAAGGCGFGLLGNKATISGCSDSGSIGSGGPVVVGLPAGEVPTTNITTDRFSTYVRTTDGKVYGWGIGDYGQLGSISLAAAHSSTSTPIQVGTWGNSGQPTANQIITDGASLYVLDSNGNVSSVGNNAYGQMGSGVGTLYSGYSSPNKCVTGNATLGASPTLTTCSEGSSQRFTIVSNSDGTVSFKYPASTRCLDSSYGGSTGVFLNTCSTAATQKWTPTTLTGASNTDSPSAWKASNGSCMSTQDGSTMTLSNCLNYSNQNFNFNSATPVPVVKPGGMTGTVSQIWSDQGSLSMLTSTGQVWTAGYNTTGQAGNGTALMINPTPLQFALPSGVLGASIYETSVGLTVPSSSSVLQNLLVIGNNGRVYGAGSNSYGQLGNSCGKSSYSGSFLSGTPPSCATTVTSPVTMDIIDGTVLRASTVQSGGGSSVVMTTGGTIYTVGNNASGQLGDGTQTNNSTPAANRYTNIVPVTLY